MNKQTAGVLSLIAALGISGAVFAQETPAPTPVVPQQQPMTQPLTTGTTTTTTTDNAASGMVTAMNQGLLASSLIGMTVYSASGEQIGEVNDIVIQPQAGTANTAIIGVGGFLGIGEKDVAIDMAQIQMVAQADNSAPRVTLNTTKDQLAAAPAFDRSAILGQGTDSATGSVGSTPSQTQQPQQ